MQTQTSTGTYLFDADALAAAAFARMQHETSDEQSCLRDLKRHIQELSRAINTHSPELFSEYCAWSALVLDTCSQAREDLASALRAIAEELQPNLDISGSKLLNHCMDSALQRVTFPNADTIEGLNERLNEDTGKASVLNAKSKARLAALSLCIFYMRQSDLALQHGPSGQAQCLRDVERHIDVLANSVQRGDFNLFAEYSRWLAQFLHWYGISRMETSAMLEAASTASDLVLEEDLADAAAESLLEAARIAREEDITPSAVLSIPNRSAMQRLSGETSRCVRDAGNDLARLTLLIFYMRHPEISLRHGDAGRSACLNDTIIHFEQLGDAMLADSGQLFTDYLEWISSVLQQAGVKQESLQALLDCMYTALALALPAEVSDAAIDFARNSVKNVQFSATTPTESYIDESTKLGRLAREFHNLLLRGERHAASTLITNAAEAGTPVADIYLDVFQASQYEIGRLWQRNEISVAQEHFCTAATQMIMSQLYPHIFRGERSGHNLVATCVTEDMHEIGIRMVCDFYEMEGWDTFYLGANTPLDAILATVQTHNADILAISATIGTHISRVRDIITAIRANADCASTHILVGGLPFLVDQELWHKLGADGCARNARDAVRLGTKLAG